MSLQDQLLAKVKEAVHEKTGMDADQVLGQLSGLLGQSAANQKPDVGASDAATDAVEKETAETEAATGEDGDETEEAEADTGEENDSEEPESGAEEDTDEDTETDEDDAAEEDDK